MRPYQIFLSEVSQHFELVLGDEKDFLDLCGMVIRRERQVLYVRRSKTKTMDTRLKMVVGDVQRRISDIPTGKTNVERGVEHSDSLLHHTSSLQN